MTSPAHPARPARPPVTRVPGPRRGTAGTPGPAPEVAGPGSPRSAIGGAGRYATWVLLLAAGHLLLARAGRVIPLPEVHDARTVLDGLVGTAPDVVAFSALRVLAGALLWYLTGLTVLGTLARVTGLPALLRLTRGLAGPGTRRLLHQAIGLGLGMSVTVPVATLGVASTGAWAQTPDPVVTMHVLDDPPAIAVAPGVAPGPGPQADPSAPITMVLLEPVPSDPTPVLAPVPVPSAPAVDPGPAGPDPRAATTVTTEPAAAEGGPAADAPSSIPAPAAQEGASPATDPASEPTAATVDPADPGPGSSTAAPEDAPAPAGDAAGRAAPGSAGDLAAGSASWTIAPGDHLWHVAEATLARTLDHRPDDAEVAVYWRALIDANRDRLVVAGEPDLVLPGQVFALPPLPRR